MDGSAPLEKPSGFAEAQDEFLAEGGAERGRIGADRELIRRLARERMLAREAGAGLQPAGIRLRGRMPVDS